VGVTTVSIAVAYDGASAYLRPQDFSKFVRKCKSESGDNWYHTVVEMVVGVFLVRAGYWPEYDRKLHSQTPDWSCTNSDGSLNFFSDVVSCHHCDAERRRVENDLATTGTSSFETYGEVERERLYNAIKDKADHYKELADTLNVPFVIFAHGTFDSNLHEAEVPYVVNIWEPKLFPLIPHVSGVCYVGCHTPLGMKFRFFGNPHATRPITLTDAEVLFPIQ